MALKVELKPGERVIIGDCVVTNADQRTRLIIEGETPILREKDILTAETANTPAKRIYLAVQLMYLSKTCVSASRNIFPAHARHRAGRAQHMAVYREHQQSYLNGRNL